MTEHPAPRRRTGRGPARQRRRTWLVMLALAVGTLPAPAAATPAPGTDRRVADSTDVVAAAVDVSAATFAAGEARHVLLGRDDLFADSLAGAALAGTGGPILFTTGGPGQALRPEAEAELRRVLGPPADCGAGFQVYLLGGRQAVSEQVERRVDELGYCAQRFAGASRVETSVHIAEHLSAAGAPSQMLLARDDDWADAATGGAYAAAAGAPVVVTVTGGLHPAVAGFLRARPPGEVVLLGGRAALSDQVAEQAAAFAPVRRVSGAARDMTAVAIARQLWGAAAAGGGVTLVNGYVPAGWAYALSSAVLAARERAVQLYTHADALSDGTSGFLADHDFAFVVAAGPPSLVSDEVRAAAAPAGRQPGAPVVLPGGDFVEAVRPIGVEVDPAGNLAVAHDATFASLVTRFAPDGTPTAQVQVGGIAVGGIGHLQRDPLSGLLWHLLPDGRVQAVDLDRGAVAELFDIRGLPVDASAVHDVSTGTVDSMGGLIQPWFSEYRDFALHAAGDTRTLLVAGHSVGFPFVLRIVIAGDQLREARVLVSSRASSAPCDALARGVAVNPQGTVLTSLPLPVEGAPVDACGNLDRLFAFPAGFAPGQGQAPAQVLGPRTIVSSRGITADAAGNFYVATSAVGITAPELLPGGGQTPGGALVILPPTLDRILAVGVHPLSLTTSFRDVAVDDARRRAYVTFDGATVLVYDLRGL